MTRVRVAGYSISLDGFGAGPEQSLENPLGKRGRELHAWMFGTRMFRAMIGKAGGSDGDAMSASEPNLSRVAQPASSRSKTTR